MQHSGTMTPSAERRQATPVALDPISEARALLHGAARLPYSVALSSQWRRRFRQRVGAAREALRRHVARSSTERHPHEHQQLVLEADALCAEASTETDVDIWRMIDLGERAILLEQALLSHSNRLVGPTRETARAGAGARGM